MAAAIALAVVLVVAVAGMSLAVQSQNPTAPGASRAPRPSRPIPTPARRARERRPPTPPPPPPPAPEPEAVVPKVPELLRNGVPARARVVNVVDERVVGPVTRSRLTLAVESDGAEGFEVVIRHAFPTPAARAAVRVGGRVAVRYDRDDHHRVLLDPEGESGAQSD